MEKENEKNYRHLTVEEQLEWYVDFLESEIANYERALIDVKQKLLEIRNKSLENLKADEIIMRK